MTEPKTNLRIALMWNGLSLARWQWECIQHILALPFAEFVLIIRPEVTPKTVKPSFAYRIFRKFTSPASLKPGPLPDALKTVAQISCKTNPVGKHREAFNEGDIEKIAALKPDVILRFGFNILSGSILDLPKYGVWSFHHGDPQVFRGGPPAFWEMKTGKKIMGSVLQRLNEKLDNGQILRRGTFKVHEHSFKVTLDQALQVSARWPAQVLKDIKQGIPDAAVGHSEFTAAPILSYPGLGDVTDIWMNLFANRIRFYFDKYLLSEDWNIGRIDITALSIADGERIPDPEWLPRGKRQEFIADPFSYELKGVRYLVYEQFNYWSGKGVIARNHLLMQDRNPERIIDRSEHLSYPYTFRYNEKNFLLTESASKNRITLYEVNESNELAEHANLLEDFPGTDPSLVYFKSKWWLFCTSTTLDGANRDLYIFHADKLEGPFQPHLNNPVLSDVRYARPAGTMFIHHDNLIRPVQDSSSGYGSFVHLMKVAELSENTFRQEVIRTIAPFKNNAYKMGIHTFSEAGTHTLIDGKRKIFRISALMLRLKSIFKPG